MDALGEMARELFIALIINPETLVVTLVEEHMDCKWSDCCYFKKKTNMREFLGGKANTFL